MRNFPFVCRPLSAMWCKPFKLQLVPWNHNDLIITNATHADYMLNKTKLRLFKWSDIVTEYVIRFSLISNETSKKKRKIILNSQRNFIAQRKRERTPPRAYWPNGSIMARDHHSCPIRCHTAIMLCPLRFGCFHFLDVNSRTDRTGIGYIISYSESFDREPSYSCPFPSCITERYAAVYYRAEDNVGKKRSGEGREKAGGRGRRRW